MQLPRSLVLFLAFCGGGVLFGAPLVLAAMALDDGAGGSEDGIAAASASPNASVDPDTDEVIGTLEFRAFDLGFEPASVSVEQSGRYVVTFVNDGAIFHDLTFADGSVLEAHPGQSATAELVVPAKGLTYICSVPGHEAGGMTGSISVVGSETTAAGEGQESSPAGKIEPNLAASEYVLREPAAPPRAEGEVHELELVMTERVMTVAEGYEQLVWTFGDEVPGPVMRVTVGDIVRITLKNPETNQMPHSIDFHSSMVAWNDEMRTIDPGEELVYEYEARYAGVYMYHCGTAPGLHHIANGMYGMIIVEPEGGLPPVHREFAFVQSEWYLGAQGEVTDLTKASAAAPAPEFVVFNGVANQYADNPIQVEVGETIRVFVLNAGPNVDSSFHVVGTIFRDVIKEGVRLVAGNEGNWGAQAVDLSPAQGAIVEMEFAEDGLYPIVTHAFNFVGRGALGLFQAGDGGLAAEGSH